MCVRKSSSILRFFGVALLTAAAPWALLGPLGPPGPPCLPRTPGPPPGCSSPPPDVAMCVWKCSLGPPWTPLGPLGPPWDLLDPPARPWALLALPRVEICFSRCSISHRRCLLVVGICKTASWGMTPARESTTQSVFGGVLLLFAAVST